MSAFAIPGAEHGKWYAAYRNRFGHFTTARDARGMAIVCDTEALALSVARYRRRRLKCFTSR